MKTVALVFVASMLLFISCKKDDASSNNIVPVPENSKIIGKWTVVSTFDSLYQNSNGLSASQYTGDSTDYIDFKKDGNQYSRLNQSQNIVPYKVLDEQTVLIDSDTFQVKTMTSNSISLYNRISYPDGWYASQLNLKK